MQWSYWEKKKQLPQFLQFRCRMFHLIYSLKKVGKTFKLQQDLLKTEMNHDEIDANNYRNIENEWLDYVKNDVICTSFSYARYTKAMEEITRFGMKDCLSLLGLEWKYFNSLRTEILNQLSLTMTSTWDVFWDKV